MPVRFCPHSAAMAQQWEIAKGHLRAVAALAGSVNSGETNYDALQYRTRYALANDRIEKFIKDFEDDGLQEGQD